MAFLHIKSITRFVCAMLLLGVATASQAEEWGIQQLMQSLAEAKPSHARFEEKKYIAILDEPVTSSGELFFTAPDHLEKRTLLPKPESLIVDGNKILIERSNKTYYFTMQSLPELGAFINSIRGTLAGDLKALKRSFTLQLEGDAKQWSLQLTPNNAKMQKLLQTIQIAGQQAVIESIRISQVDGDSSYMTITPADTRHD